MQGMSHGDHSPSCSNGGASHHGANSTHTPAPLLPQTISTGSTQVRDMMLLYQEVSSLFSHQNMFGCLYYTRTRTRHEEADGGFATQVPLREQLRCLHGQNLAPTPRSPFKQPMPPSPLMPPSALIPPSTIMPLAYAVKPWVMLPTPPSPLKPPSPLPYPLPAAHGVCGGNKQPGEQPGAWQRRQPPEWGQHARHVHAHGTR